MKKILLTAIIILGFVLRLYRINFPLADWHSWRQADTSAVSRNFIKHTFDLLHPRFDDLSPGASGKENLQGYRFVEFPVYNLIHAKLYQAFPIFSLEKWGRLVSIFCSLISLVFLYLISERYLGWQMGLLAAFFFAVLPFNIYYSRTILPESMMLMASLAMIYFWDKAIAFVFFAALTFLFKPFALVLLLPLFYLAGKNYRLLFLNILISLLPFFLWRIWMGRFLEGIPRSAWLFNEAGIRFKGAWFWWLFGERIGRLILGGWGLIPLVLGIIVRPGKKEGWFFHFWLVGILAYFTIIAAGNVQHDYYQVLAIPIICIFLAKGSYFLLTIPKEFFSKVISCLLLVVSCSFMLAFSWYQVRDFFNINNPAIVEAGRALDKLVAKEAKVIAPYGGDTAFLYQTNRQGWPIGGEIERKIKLGAEYYITVVFDEEAREVEKKYCVIAKTSRWAITDLTRTCSQE